MTQQSNTTESDLAYADAREKYMLGEDGNDWFNRCVAMLECARKLERERDEARKKTQEYRGLLYGCDNHGLWDGLSCIGCVEAERDQLRKVVDELHWLASLADYDNHRRDDALSSYNNLPHVIARKEMK